MSGQIAKRIGYFVVGMSLLVLLGWLLNIVWLKSLHANLATMKVNTALSFALLGSALFLPNEKSPRLRQVALICAGLAATISFLSLAQYVFGWNLGIDELFFKDLETAVANYPGRMSPATAICLALTSIALILQLTKHYLAAHIVALFVAFVGLLALIGYLYDVRSLYQIFIFSSMALHTAVAFVLLNVAILLLRTDVGLSFVIFNPTAGGAIVRRLGPAVILGPVVIGFVIRLARERFGFSRDFAFSLVIVSEIVVLFVILLWSARSLYGVDEKRRYSDRLFKLSMDASPSASILVDQQGTISLVNPQVEFLFGYAKEELVGKPIEILVPTEFHAHHHQYRDAFLSFPVARPMGSGRDLYGLCKDGSLVPVEIGLNPIQTKEGHFVLASIIDITERKRAEAERERLMARVIEQAKKEQFIVDTVPEGILLLDDSDIQLTNPVAKEYLSLLAPDWQNTRLTHLGERPLETLMTSPPKGFWHELECNGRSFEIIARPVEDGPDQHGWVFVLRDVTQERQIQQQIQSQERLAAVGQLAAGIAHDFNNSLAVIKLYTDILAHTAVLDGQPSDKLQTISQQTQRAADLIQQILDFSRQSLMERQLLDLQPFLKELTRLLDRTLPENIQISLTPSQVGKFIIFADPSRIQQAILNLAFNARDALPRGGQLTFSLKRLTLETKKSVPVSGMSLGEWVQLSVADSGLGMPPEVLDHIFEPFFTTKERGKGTGLGLAQVYGIVQQHDGFIDVVSTVAQGTTFLLYLPAHAEAHAAVPQAVPESMPLGDGQLILVVEDEEIIRMALTESLTLLNYRVIEARNGRAALPLFDEYGDDIALIVSDIIMPEMGGIALLHNLRERNLDIPFVMITGYAVEKDMENLRAMGLRGWLAKPLDLEKLAQLLQKVLN